MRYFLNTAMYNMIYFSKYIVSDRQNYLKINPNVYEDLVTLSNLKSKYIQHWVSTLKVNRLIYLPDCFVHSNLFSLILYHHTHNLTFIVNKKTLHHMLKHHKERCDMYQHHIDFKYQLPEPFIRYEMNLYGPSLLPWESISQYPKLSLEFVIEFNKYIDWEVYVSTRYLSYDNIDILAPYIDWNRISKLHDMDRRFLEQVKDHLNWDIMSTKRNILDDKYFIIKYQKYLNWEIIMTNDNDKRCYEFIQMYKRDLDIDMLLEKGIITKLHAKILKQ